MGYGSKLLSISTPAALGRDAPLSLERIGGKYLGSDRGRLARVRVADRHSWKLRPEVQGDVNGKRRPSDEIPSGLFVKIEAESSGRAGARK
jgi:hypothetical protein